MNSCFLSMRRQTNHGPISQHIPSFTVYTVMWNICRLPIPPPLLTPSPKRRLFYRHEKLIELECVHMKEKEEEKEEKKRRKKRLVSERVAVAGE